jgi:TPR repeat protein
MQTDTIPTNDDAEPELPGARPPQRRAGRGPAHVPFSGFAHVMDEEEFATVQNLAIEGDPDAMVDFALELRRRGDPAQALEWLTRAGDAGHSRAISELAATHFSQAAQPDHTVESLHWVKRAAEGGRRDCMLLLARAYRDGEQGLARDYKQMLSWALRAAAAHSSEAMRLVSDAYALGQGVAQNTARALIWLRRAAAAGDAAAIQRLAGRYLTGQGVDLDPRSFFQWTRKGAEGGDPTLMFNLAEAYRDGTGTEVDNAAFFRWISKAADRNYPAALFELGLAYRDGVGVKPDAAEYRRLLMRAAEAGDPQAMNNLALQYLHGTGVAVDVKRHVELLTRAAQAGEPSAMFNLAHAYRDGLGVARNQEQYLVWLRQCAQLRHPHALVEMAAHYFRLALSDTRALDFEQAALDARFEQLATAAAEAGDARGMYLLAMAHRLGVGVLNDPKLSREWTERAAQAGLPAAMLDLADLHRDAPDAESDPQSYFAWIKRAAEAGDVVAKRRLALAYHDGEGTERDLDACRRWLEVAATQGDQAAFVLLGLLDLERDGEIEATLLHTALEPFMGLQAEVDKIKRAHLVREAPEGVAHFTTLGVLHSLLAGGAEQDPNNRLRLYNTAYLKDAQDGRRLFDLDGSAAATLLRGFFPEQHSRDWPLTSPWDGREYSVYLGAFNLRADYLDLWRAHGADGTGVCIVTPLAAFAQDKQRLPFTLAAGAAAPGASPRTVTPVLYRMEYDPAVAAEALQGMQPHLEAIQAFRDLLKSGGAVVEALVRILLSEILYLFKPEAYQGEREARMLVAFDISSEYVQRDAASEPGRLYVETEPFLLSAPGSHILIGPAVKDRAAAYLDLRYRLAKSRWSGSTRVSYSSIEYR